MQGSRTLTVEVLEQGSIEVDADALRAALQRADPDVTVVVLVAPGTTASQDQRDRIAAMLDHVSARTSAVLGRVPATSAVKRVVDGRVAASLDRERLCVVAPPAVLDRSALERVLEVAPAELGAIVRPLELMAAAGEGIAVVD